MTHDDRIDSRCLDCGMETQPRSASREYYMLWDELWDETGGGDGMLCVGCVELRLGRELSREDFSDTNINGREYWHLRSDRLVDRLKRQHPEE